MSDDRLAQIEIGDTADLEHTISAADVDTFVRLTGDTNPVHLDQAFAWRAGLGDRVVHGMLTAGFISTVIGTRLPGPGARWLRAAVPVHQARPNRRTGARCRAGQAEIHFAAREPPVSPPDTTPSRTRSSSRRRPFDTTRGSCQNLASAASTARWTPSKCPERSRQVRRGVARNTTTFQTGSWRSPA